MTKYKLEAINWNIINDPHSKLFWNQNIRQFWVDEEIPLSDDKLTWATLTPEEKTAYTYILGGLTLLDSAQGTIGMPKISLAVENTHSKAILSFMGMMEHMHTKSYSCIFTTLCNTKEIDDIFNFAKENSHLQEKVDLIVSRYHGINDKKTLYIAMVASVFLESFLFYSGFFYPLYLSGQGKMVASGEIINLIIRDESIHGVYVGLIAQEIFNNLSEKDQTEASKALSELLENLYKIEISYTKLLYNPLGLEKEVDTFVRYNADKALMNLGQPAFFNIDDAHINPVVLRGLDTKTKTHDFFSTKGNGYIKPTKVEKLSDDDFNV